MSGDNRTAFMSIVWYLDSLGTAIGGMYAAARAGGSSCSGGALIPAPKGLSSTCLGFSRDMFRFGQ